MNLKSLLIPTIIVLSFLALTLYISSQEIPNGLPEKKNFSASISLLETGIANSGEENVAFAIINANFSGVEKGEAKLLWLETPPLLDVFFLEYPYTEAREHEAFKSALLARLSSSGFRAGTATIDKALKLRNSVLIVPTGILPAAVNDNLPTLLENGNAIVFIGREPSYVLEADGSIAKNENPSLNYSEGALRLSNGYFLSTGKTLDELGTWRDSSSQIYDLVMRQGWQEPIASGSRELKGSHSGAFSLFTSESKVSSGYLLFLSSFSSANGSTVRSAIPSEPGSLPGELRGADSIFPGEPLRLRLSINQSRASPVFLVLKATAFKDGKSAFSKEIGEANLKDLWLSSFELPSTFVPGDYIISVSDQFDAKYARAFLHVKNLSVAMLEANPPDYALSVLLDGKPLDSETASVSLDSSNTSEKYPIVNGRLALAAKAAKGEHTFTINVLGQERKVRFSNEAETPLDIYMKFGIPGAAIILLVYLYFRRKPSQRYRLVLPQEGESRGRRLAMRESELLSIFDEVSRSFGWEGVPLSLAELRNGIRKRWLAKGADALVSDENLLEALSALEKKGKVAGFMDYFSPAGWLKGESMEAVVLRRLVRDSLIESGTNFQEKGGIITAITRRGKLQFCVYDDDDGIFRMAKGAKKAIIFTSRAELEEFRRSLTGGSSRKARLAVMLQNNSLLLLTPEGIRDAL